MVQCQWVFEIFFVEKTKKERHLTLSFLYPENISAATNHIHPNPLTYQGETLSCNLSKISIHSLKRDILQTYYILCCTTRQSTSIKNSPEAEASGLLRLPYTCSVGVSVLVNTILANHTAPCMTVGNTTASRQ